MGAEKEVFVALAGATAWIEYVSGFRDKMSRDEKKTINNYRKTLEGFEYHFRKQGLHKHPHYDEMVGVFIEAYAELQKVVVSPNTQTEELQTEATQ